MLAGVSRVAFSRAARLANAPSRPVVMFRTLICCGIDYTKDTIHYGAVA